MNHDDLRDLLSAYLDGELPSDQAELTATHLEQCAACREELAVLRHASHLLSSLPAPRLTGDLAPAVVARAAIPSWREAWGDFGRLLVERRAVIGRQLARAAIIAILFLLAAAGPRSNLGEFIISWPVRVAGVTADGMTRLTAVLAKAQTFIESESSPVASPAEKRKSSPGEQSRGPALLI